MAFSSLLNMRNRSVASSSTSRRSKNTSHSGPFAVLHKSRSSPSQNVNFMSSTSTSSIWPPEIERKSIDMVFPRDIVTDVTVLPAEIPIRLGEGVLPDIDAGRKEFQSIFPENSAPANCWPPEIIN